MQTIFIAKKKKKKKKKNRGPPSNFKNLLAGKLWVSPIEKYVNSVFTRKYGGKKKKNQGSLFSLENLWYFFQAPLQG